MPQVLKVEIKEQILRSGLKVFSKNGFVKTRMGDIAQEAGLSTGNLYRYFQDKEEVFDNVLPSDFVEEFLSVFKKRVKQLSSITDWTVADGTGDGAAKDLLEFMIKDRERSLILLKGAEGTAYSEISAKLVDELSKSAVEFLKKKKEKKHVSIEELFIIREILSNTLSTMTNILSNHQDPIAIRNAFSTFWRYHLAGLQTLLKG